MLCCVALFLVVLFLTKELPGACYYHARTLPVKVYAHMGVFSPSKNAVYLFGGLTGTSLADNQFVQAIFKWDFNVAGSWFEYIGTPYDSGAVQFVSWNNNAVLVGDLVFFIGIGIEGGGATDQMFVYDLNAESFSSQSRARVPTASVAGCLTTNGTHIFMMDGRDFTATVHPPVFYVYDIAGDAWESHPLSMGVTTTGGWRQQYCSLVGDLLYVAGGHTDGKAFAEIFSVDVRTLQAEFLGVLPQSDHGGAAVYDNDEANLYLIGGWSMGTNVIAFNVDANSVSTAFQTQDAISSGVVLTINNKIYRFGGQQNVAFFATDKVEICDFPSPTTNNPTTSNPTTNNPTTASPTTTGPTTTGPTTTGPTNNPTTASPTTTGPTSSPVVVNVSFPTSGPVESPTSGPVDGNVSSPASGPVDGNVPSPTNHTFSASSPPNVPGMGSQFGVNVTVIFADALPQNETQIVIDGLNFYALEKTSTLTVNCSEIVSTPRSHTEDPNLVWILSIITCSQSTEDELLAAIDDGSELQTRLANLTELGPLKIEIQSLGEEATSTVAPAPSNDSAKPLSWLYVWFGVTCGLACVLLFCCVLLVFVYRRQRRRMSHDPNSDGKDVAVGEDEPPRPPGMGPPMFYAIPQYNNAANANAMPPGMAPIAYSKALAAVPPPPLNPAIQMVQTGTFEYGSDIDDEIYCERTPTKTTRAHGFKKKKGRKIQGGEHQEEAEPMFVQLLRSWGLEEFETVFRDNGWTDIAAWSAHYLTLQHLQDMGLKAGHIATFQRKCSEMFNANQAMPLRQAHAVNDRGQFDIHVAQRMSQYEGHKRNHSNSLYY